MNTMTRRPSHRWAVRILCLLGILLLTLPAAAQRREAPPRQDGAPGLEEGRRDEVVQFIRENFPLKARLLEELRQRNPEEFQRRRQRLAEEVRHLLDLRERDSELFRVHLEEMGLRDELNRLAREARREKAGSKERQEAERKLKEAVQRSFDLRHRIKEAELKELRGRLAELEGSLERRASRRSEMIDERLRELLGSGEEDW
ncbi:MAG: hypothetical protein Q8O14_06025 [bacterium]|nr:hypothetical protein [bacterium]